MSSGNPDERSAGDRIVRPALLAGITTLRRGWLPAAIVVAVMSMLSAVVTLLAISLAEPLARHQGTMLLNSNGIGVSPVGLGLLMAELAVPAGIVITFITAAGLGALMRVVDSVQRGAEVRLSASVRHGARRAPAMVASLLLLGLGVLLLAAATPLLVPVGALGLLAVLGGRVLGRRLPVPTWMLVAAVIPLGAALAALVRGALAPALVALEPVGPIDALRRSTHATTGHRGWAVSVALMIAFGGYLVVQFGIGAASALGGAELIVVVVAMFVQTVTFAVPVGVVVALARRLRDPAHPVDPLPAQRRSTAVTAAAVVASLALFLGTAMVAVPSPAFASETPPAETPPGESPPDDGGGETPVGQLPTVDDPRFTIGFSVAEGTRTVEGEPISFRVTGAMADGGQLPRAWYVDFFELDAEAVATPIGTGQVGYDGGVWFMIDPNAHPMPAGEHEFIAGVYQMRDGVRIDGPTTSLTHEIAPGAHDTVTSLQIPTTTITIDDALSMSATVVGADGPITEGIVEFRSSSGLWSPSQWVAIDAGGRAETAFTGLQYGGGGARSFVAIYHGAAPHRSSESNPVTVTVQRRATTVELVQSTASSASGDLVELTASVVGSDGQVPQFSATGVVQFMLGDPQAGTLLGEAVYLDGVAVLETTALPIGGSLISAVFPGDSDFYEPSVSAPIAHGVGVVPVTLLVESTAGAAVPIGASTTIKIDAMVPPGAAPVVDGTLEVTVDGVTEVIDIATQGFSWPVQISRSAIIQPISVTAVYAGSSTHAAVAAASSEVGLRAAATTVVLSRNGAALPGDDQVVVVAVIGEVPGRAPGTGTVEYQVVGDDQWHTATFVDGSAQLAVPLGLGEHTLEARYRSVDLDSWADSPVVSISLDVAAAATSITVGAPTPPPRAGAAFALAGEVTASAPFMSPSGGVIVVLDDDGVELGRTALDGFGRFEVTVPGLPLGEHDLVVRFLGTATHSPSEVPTTLSVVAWPTSTVLSVSPSAVAGESLSIVATVATDAPADVAAVEGGVVEFSTAAGIEIGVATVVSTGASIGRAELTVTLPVSLAGHRIIAEFIPRAATGAALVSSRDERTVIVTRASTEVAITTSPALPATGQLTFVTAVVDVIAPSTLAATGGSVTFSGPLFSTPQVVAIDAEGIARAVIRAPVPTVVGTQITATYSGTALLGGTSTETTLESVEGVVEIRATSTQPSVGVGESAQINVTIAPVAGGGLPASGRLELLVDGVVAGTRDFTVGANTSVSSVTEAFTFETPAELAIGAYELVGRLVDAPGFADATSAPSQLEVVAIETRVIAVVSPAGSTQRGQDATITATVRNTWDARVPTGWVHLLVDGVVTATLAVSTSGSGAANAVFDLPDLPTGAHELAVEFEPLGTLFAASESDAFAHEITGRPTTIVAGLPPLIAGRSQSMVVEVRSGSGIGAIGLTGAVAPSGFLQLRIDGAPVGSAQVLVPGVGASATATLVIPGSAVLAGVHEVEIRYVPTDDLHSSAIWTRTDTAVAAAPVITIGAGNPALQEWGLPTWIHVGIGRATDDIASEVAPPSGAPLVTIVGGDACVADGVTSFRCTPTTAGDVVVRVDYPGDANYTASTNSAVIAEALKRTPSIIAGLETDSFDGAIETGAWQTLRWNVTGPVRAPTVIGLGAVTDCRLVADGDCAFTLDTAAGGVSRTVSLSLAADARWNAASWSATFIPAACSVLELHTDPVIGGTLTTTSTAQPCLNGGVREGALVDVTATPNLTGTAGATWRFDGFTLGAAGTGAAPSTAGGFSPTMTVAVGTGAGRVSSVTARFALVAQCAAVMLVESSPTSSIAGSLFTSVEPNCPGRPGWSIDRMATTGDGSQQIATGWFVIGTTIQPTTSAFGGSEIYGTRTAVSRIAAGALPIVPGAIAPVVVTGQTWIEAVIGPRCLALTLVADGPGVISTERNTGLGTCQDPNRRTEYVDGSVVAIRAVPDAGATAYVAEITGIDDGTFRLVGGTDSDRRRGITVAAVTVSTIDRTVTANFDACIGIEIAPVNGGWGTVAAGTAENCPVRPTHLSSTSWYTHGTKVSFTATAIETSSTTWSPRFGQWNLPDRLTTITGWLDNTSPTISFTAMESVVLRPSFFRPDQCSIVSLTVGPGLAAQLNADTPQLTCRDERLFAPSSNAARTGSLVAGTVTANLAVTDGAPLVGWSYSIDGATIGFEGSQLTASIPGASTVRIAAVACQRIAAYVGIADAAGEVSIGVQRDGTMVETSPAPNCPYDPRAWTVGTAVSFTAGGDPAGYEFIGWGGAAGETTGLTSAPYVVSAASASVVVTAAYQVVCHSLTVEGRAHRVTMLPEPNCPGAQQPGLVDGVFTGSYVGGTAVALFGEVPGGNVWQGWRGDLVEEGRVKVAVAVMDADKKVEHRYRGKTDGEKAGEFFEDTGNALATAAKKTVGGLAFAMGEAFQKVPPFNVVGLALTGVSLIGTLLEQIGVPSSVTKYFSYPAQSYQWAFTSFTCIAGWALSGDSDVNLADTRSAVQAALDSTTIAGDQVDPSSGAPNDPTTSEALTALYYTAKAGSFVAKHAAGITSTGTALDVVDVALAGYALATNAQGIGWDSSASSAWDANNYLQRTSGCMEAAMPDYIKNAIEVPDGYWDDKGARYAP